VAVGVAAAGSRHVEMPGLGRSAWDRAGGGPSWDVAPFGLGCSENGGLGRTQSGWAFGEGAGETGEEGVVEERRGWVGGLGRSTSRG
jgi:hypothetical protein